MKRSFILVISCVCALALALFAMTACGGGSSDSSQSSASSSAASSDASGTEGAEEGNPEDATASSMSSDEVRSVFEQAVTGMSEYYKGTTPVGEQLYYAGGADGENAILVLVVPESSASAVFIGPATVGDDNKLTVQDETTGSSISFAVIDNGDGTYSFSMGDQYGAAVMSRCSSAEVVDALTEVVMATSAAQAGAQGTAQGQDQAQPQE